MNIHEEQHNQLRYALKKGILVLSTELIMFICRLQEILDLTSRAMALLQL